jgi:hypothetical protein
MLRVILPFHDADVQAGMMGKGARIINDNGSQLPWMMSQCDRRGLDLRYEVLTAVKMSMLVFSILTPCGFVGRYQRFVGTASSFGAEDEGSMFLRNVRDLIQGTVPAFACRD